MDMYPIRCAVSRAIERAVKNPPFDRTGPDDLAQMVAPIVERMLSIERKARRLEIEAKRFENYLAGPLF